MIYIEAYKPDKSKEFRWKTMLLRKSQEVFSIDANSIYTQNNDV
jgi:hypothetical protein